MRVCLGLALSFLVALCACDRLPQRGMPEPSAERQRAGSMVRPVAATDTRVSATAGGDTPVVVELFSSEGCSSCPPADVVLHDLSIKQGLAGANVIALELHVDYWNDLGWSDPFSNAAFSARQREYANVMARRGVFTPEAIVDGRASVLGTDRSAVEAEVQQAATRPHLGVALGSLENGALEASLSELPREPSSFWLAITESGLETVVTAGENRGRTLRHAPVVRSLGRVATVTALKTQIALPEVRAQRGELAAVVFIQRDADHVIVGANKLPLALR
jgi:hypothetical protein